MRRSYGWVVVGAGMVMTGLSFGAMMSLAVLLIPMAQETGWSRSGISSVATINFLFMGIGSILWGMLSDRIGARRVVRLGRGAPQSRRRTGIGRHGHGVDGGVAVRRLAARPL